MVSHGTQNARHIQERHTHSLASANILLQTDSLECNMLHKCNTLHAIAKQKAGQDSFILIKSDLERMETK